MIALVEGAPGAGYEVVAVASDIPGAAGIGWSIANGIPTLAASPKELGGKAAFEKRVEAFLRQAGVDVIALAGYMRILSPGFVARWPGRILNIHPSLLPLHKGLHTHARAIAAGDAYAGCSVHLVTDELDAGAVLGQALMPVLPDDTPETLAARVLVEEHRLYPRILSEYCRAMSEASGPTPLDHLRRTALALPEVEERAGDPVAFTVADEAFAELRDGRTLRLRGDTGWDGFDLAGDIDWPALDDAVARAWELTAPADLLEAGGR